MGVPCSNGRVYNVLDLDVADDLICENDDDVSSFTKIHPECLLAPRTIDILIDGAIWKKKCGGAEQFGSILWPDADYEAIERTNFDRLVSLEGYRYTRNSGTKTSRQYVCTQTCRKRRGMVNRNVRECATTPGNLTVTVQSLLFIRNRLFRFL